MLERVLHLLLRSQMRGGDVRIHEREVVWGDAY